MSGRAEAAAAVAELRAARVVDGSGKTSWPLAAVAAALELPLDAADGILLDYKTNSLVAPSPDGWVSPSEGCGMALRVLRDRRTGNEGALAAPPNSEQVLAVRGYFSAVMAGID